MSFAQSQRFLPTLTGLDDRIVPSAVLSNRVLTVYGTSTSDTITVRQSGDTISVREAFSIFSQVSYHSAAKVDKIVILGGAGTGNDTLDVRGVLKPTLLFGEGGNDVIYGGERQDVIWGGEGNDSVYGYGGNDSLYGEGGADYLNGGAGADYLRGGTGYDRFALDRYDTIRLSSAPLSSGGFGLNGSGDTQATAIAGNLQIDPGAGGTVTSIVEQPRIGFWLTQPNSPDDLVTVTGAGTLVVSVDSE